MDAFQVIWAISATFYGLLGIWAAVVRRHWFLRFAVVGVFLFGALLIPAYEVVIEFGIQIVFIAAGVRLARGRANWQPRLSLETALLAMVVVAIVAAVAGQMPTLPLSEWIDVLSIGVCTALISLLALWFVCGKLFWPIRLAVSTVALGAWIALFHFLMSLEQSVANSGDMSKLIESYKWEDITGWLKWWLPTMALAGAILLFALWLARRSGWFTEHDGSTATPVRRAQRMARFGLCTLLLILFLPLGYLGFRLMTPEPLPAVAVPTPNGYEDLVAAGLMAPSNITSIRDSVAIDAVPPMTDAALAAEVQSLQPLFDRIALGLSRPCAPDLRVIAENGESSRRLQTVFRAADDALWLRYAQFYRAKNVVQRKETALEILHFNLAVYRGTGWKWPQYAPNSQSAEFAVSELRDLLTQLGVSDCRDAARRLADLEQIREPWSEQVRLQRIINEHRGWMIHMQMELQDWSGADRYEWELREYLRHLTDHRLLEVAYAVRAYCLEQRKAPSDLAALIPAYLPAMPIDPYGNGSVELKITETSAGVSVYSIGVNAQDDRGVPYPVDSRGVIDDSQGDRVLKISAADLGLDMPDKPETTP